ncbi:HNH endonuclease signature motif containing protein [Nocardioides sp. URHA0020]|uniref:HNH endonuclease signature motif containing protein n=1 Tax=Nocardioides sp. URHA0020 TaxID=1380392 RepID=UPI0018CC44FE|nr:HNH endonuclease signature motif containing protein [Nocardioides sp. URHA0020]
MRDKDLRARATKSVDQFQANSVTLQTAIHTQALHGVTSAQYKVAGLSDDELKALYKGQLSRQNSKARHLYDHVMSNALHSLCSYCQYGVANTLDHFIPITVVPGLAIDLWNLVPACDRCNKHLLDAFDYAAEHQMLHPYAMPASVPPSARWLRAAVHPGPVAAVSFHADPDSSLDDLTRARIIHQFTRLDLGVLFQVVAARELSGTCRNLAERFPGGKPQPVAAHLRELSDDALAADPNDRRGVMYEALATDEWFTTVGYEVGIEPATG